MSDPLGRIKGMDLLAQPLADLQSQSARSSRSGRNRACERATESELARQVAMIAEIGRFAEALLIDAVGEVMRRSENPVRDERMTSHLGCHDVTETSPDPHAARPALGGAAAAGGESRTPCRLGDLR